MENRPLEVVVVDDEEQITELLKTFIQFASSKTHVITFNDSLVALDYIRSHAIDVLISDYKMPRLDGIQLLSSADDSVKKVLISGYVSEIAEEKILKMNASFFEKPVPIQKLKALIVEEVANLA